MSSDHSSMYRLWCLTLNWMVKSVFLKPSFGCSVINILTDAKNSLDILLLVSIWKNYASELLKHPKCFNSLNIYAINSSTTWVTLEVPVICNFKLCVKWNFSKIVKKRDLYIINTSIERKLRVLQLQGIKSEAVIIYCESLITPKMGYHRLSRRGNKMKKEWYLYLIYRRYTKIWINQAIPLIPM